MCPTVFWVMDAQFMTLPCWLRIARAAPISNLIPLLSEQALGITLAVPLGRSLAQSLNSPHQ